MPRKLKVYRTPIGFHDAYVAAPSQKAALEAWGSDADLLARGIAEIVTDEALTREPLKKPGTVIRRLRGTNEEQMAAAEASPRRTRPHAKSEAPRRGRPAPSAKPARQKPKPKPHPTKAEAPAPAKPKKPLPSRAALDAAEQAVERAAADHAEAVADLLRREDALRQERRALEKDHEAEMAKLEALARKARERYSAALEKWNAG